MGKRAANFALVALACLAGARLGLWFLPFVAGVLEAVVRPRPGRVLTAVAGAVAGWGLSLWIMALSSLPVGATARGLAALAGLPPYAGVTITVTLLLAALQALAGAWLGRAACPVGRSLKPVGDRLRATDNEGKRHLTRRSSTCAGQPCTSRPCGTTPRKQARPATGCCCGPGTSAS